MIVLKLKALQLKILKFEELERETRFELATSTLARKMPIHSSNVNFSLEMLQITAK
jgi:hypothetical protein